MKSAAAKQKDVINVPSKISDVDILTYISNRNINNLYFNQINTFTQIPDNIVSSWFHVSPKTFRTYRFKKNKFDKDLQERILIVLSLLNHGKQIFGSHKDFDQWLQTENFYLNGKKPVSFFDTITGMRFIDDRLTAMEYGDNV